MHVLIEPGVSHSFVKLKAVLRLGLVVSSLQCLLLVSGPKCDPSVMKMICLLVVCHRVYYLVCILYIFY